MNPHRWKLLQIVNIGTFMSTLDAGIINIALPSMAVQYGTGLAQAQWVVTSYLLMLVALLPLLGKWSDRSDRRRLYGWGFAVFTAGSLLAALSESFGLVGLVISRCVQGFGAALIMANSQAMVRMLFPDHERGKALGVNAIVISLGTLAGPAVGGLLLEWLSWPWLFLINLPLGGVAVYFAWRSFPTHTPNRQGSMDWLGSCLLAIMTCILMLVSLVLEQEGWTVRAVAWSLFALLLGLCFILYERKLGDGILDPVMYRHRAIAIGNFSGFSIHLVQMATLLPITFYMQGVLGYSTGKIGAILTLQAIFMGISSPLAGWFRDRKGALLPTVGGPLLCGFSAAWIVWGALDILAITVFLSLFGIGLGCFQATNNAEIMSAAPDAKVSLVGSMLALLRYLGMVAGTALAVIYVGSLGGGTVQPSEVTAYTEGMRQLFLLCGVLGMIVAGVGLFRQSSRPRESGRTFGSSS